MEVFFNLKNSRLWCRCSRLFLAIGWVFGLTFGILLSIQAGDLLLPLMRTAEFGRVSIVSLLSALLLPLFLSAVVVYSSAVWMLPIIAFLKGFLFSFLMHGFMASSGGRIDAYWLLMLYDCCMTPMLMLYWFQHVSGERRFRYAALLPAAFTAVCIVFLRFFIDTPHLAGFIR